MFGIGEALEIDVERLADGAAAAVRRDHEIGGKGALAIWRVRANHDLVLALAKVGDRMAEQQAHAGNGHEPRVHPVHQLELLALEPIGVPRVVAENREVELGDAAALAVAILHGRGLEAHGDQRLRHAAVLEQVEGRRMECRCPVIDDRRGLALEDRDGNARAGEDECRDRAYRPAADDHHAIVLAFHGVPYWRASGTGARQGLCWRGVAGAMPCPG